MILDALTDVAAVHKAAQEYRSIGKTAFRDRYGYGGVQRYWVVVDGQLHDAKPSLAWPTGTNIPKRALFRTVGSAAAKRGPIELWRASASRSSLASQRRPMAREPGDSP